MTWLPTQSVVAVTLAVAVVSAVAFSGVLASLELAPPDARYVALGVEVWLGCLAAVGLVVFANTLTVAVHGVSLL